MRTLKPVASTAALLFLFLSQTALATDLDRRVRIVNQTGYTIMEFYGSNTGRHNWEEDVLGLDVIPSNTSMIINFDDGSGYCMLDFKVIFEDGDMLTRERVNVCEVGTLTYN